MNDTTHPVPASAPESSSPFHIAVFLGPSAIVADAVTNVCFYELDNIGGSPVEDPCVPGELERYLAKTIADSLPDATGQPQLIHLIQFPGARSDKMLVRDALTKAGVRIPVASLNMDDVSKACLYFERYVGLTPRVPDPDRVTHQGVARSLESGTLQPAATLGGDALDRLHAILADDTLSEEATRAKLLDLLTPRVLPAPDTPNTPGTPDTPAVPDPHTPTPDTPTPDTPAVPAPHIPTSEPVPVPVPEPVPVPVPAPHIPTSEQRVFPFMLGGPLATGPGKQGTGLPYLRVRPDKWVHADEVLAIDVNRPVAGEVTLTLHHDPPLVLRGADARAFVADVLCA